MIERPLNDCVFFRRDVQSGTSAGGILVPAHPKNEPSMFGVVVAAGPKASVKEGDRCMIGVREGQMITYMGEKLVVIKDIDIMGVVEP